jgi:hypothetical protein
VFSGALLMGFSRVFVGAHHPHDVLAGFVLGGLTAWLVIRMLTGPLTGFIRTLTVNAGEATTRLMARDESKGLRSHPAAEQAPRGQA